MKILYYDCFSGISGDMNLGVMIDLGVAPDYLLGELKKLNIGEYEVKITRDQRKGITGTKVEVIVNSAISQPGAACLICQNISKTSSRSSTKAICPQRSRPSASISSRGLPRRKERFMGARQMMSISMKSEQLIPLSILSARQFVSTICIRTG